MRNGQTQTVGVMQDKLTAKYVRGVLLWCYYVGEWDKDGVVYQVWRPYYNRLSAWCRLETDGRRPSMMYDAGYSMTEKFLASCERNRKNGE